VSQVSSALWVGDLTPSGREVTGAGMSYALPRDADGGIRYRTAEGVSWLAPDQVVMVSDKASRSRTTDAGQRISRSTSSVSHRRATKHHRAGD